jgi:hypothetical protein
VGTLEGDVELMRLWVSIQLMSPASGDVKHGSDGVSDVARKVSIQLMSPASGDYESRKIN